MLNGVIKVVFFAIMRGQRSSYLAGYVMANRMSIK